MNVKKYLYLNYVNFNGSRDLDNDDYVCLIFVEDSEEVRREYLEILKQYNLDKDMAEYEDILCSDAKWNGIRICFLYVMIITPHVDF